MTENQSKISWQGNYCIRMTDGRIVAGIVPVTRETTTTFNTSIYSGNGIDEDVKSLGYHSSRELAMAAIERFFNN